jgi:hypothetical protein
MSEQEQAPKLPAQMSSDGHEVWDWCGKMSEHIHRQDRIKNLRARIIKIGTVCGDCSKWMKSSECPQERSTMSGYNKGPSCEGRKCEAFVEAARSTNHRATLTAELAKESA